MRSIFLADSRSVFYADKIIDRNRFCEEPDRNEFAKTGIIISKISNDIQGNPLISSGLGGFQRPDFLKSL